MIRVCRIQCGIIICLLCYSFHVCNVTAEELNSRDSFGSLNRIQLNYENDTDESDTLISGNETGLRDKKDLKDPTLAVCYAIFPGIFLHGSGNFYAGNRKVGTIFLVSGLWFLAGYIGNNMGPFYDEPGYSPPREDDSHSRAQLCLLFYCIIWAADMITAPISCKRYNERIKKNRLSFTPIISRHNACNYAALKINYHL